MTPATEFVVLVILDGWGIAPKGPGNARSLAKTPNFDKFLLSYPNTELSASGKVVGLPGDEPGNTETGHVNLGAGRIVYQDLARINMSIAEGTFFNNEVLLGAIDHAKKKKSNLHLMGLVGAGGVHSNIDHLFALIQLCTRNNFNRIFLHLFTDGRDSPPTSSSIFVSKIKEVLKREKAGQIASIMGRYWAMDRDRRWERTEKAYLALTKGEGVLVTSAEEAIKKSYDSGKTDEFILPSIIVNDKKKPIATINDQDSVIFYNFRIDRPRQLTKAFVAKDFSKDIDRWDFDPYAIKYEKKHSANKPSGKTFKRGKPLNDLYFVMMTEYGKPLVSAGAKEAFPPEMVVKPLGNLIAASNMKQLRVAESEKSRFVTYYFNGQTTTPFPGEDRTIIPSPKVPTYDQKPEMSAEEITKTVIKNIESRAYSFILINFANPDMLAHTGNIGPAVKAIEFVDQALGKIANTVLTYQGTLLVTADHGNAEEMINLKTGAIDTEHSMNNVPFLVISNAFMGKSQKLQSGILADVAPTIVSLLGLEIPAEMTGRDLLKEIVL